MHKSVHHIGPAHQIACVLENPQNGEKDGQDGDKGHHQPRSGQHAVDEQAAQPVRRAGHRCVQPRAQRLDPVDVDPFLEGSPQGVGQPKGDPQHGEQHADAPDGMCGDAVQLPGDRDLSGTRTDDGGANDAPDPVIASPGNVEDRVLVGAQHAVYPLPALGRQLPLHHPCDLSVPFEKLECDPGRRVRRGDIFCNDRLDLLQDGTVVGPDRGCVGPVVDLTVCQGVDGLCEPADALGLGCAHRYHRDAQCGPQYLRFDLDALLRGDIHHVQGQNDRRGQHQQLGQQVQASLQDGSIDHGDDHVGPLANDVLACDPLLFRVGGQAVRARQVYEVAQHAVVAVGTRLLCDGLAGPVADVLVHPGENVKDRRLAHVWLPGQRDSERANDSVENILCSGGCRFLRARRLTVRHVRVSSR